MTIAQESKFYELDAALYVGGNGNWVFQISTIKPPEVPQPFTGSDFSFCK